MALMHDSVLTPVQQDPMSSLAYMALRSALLRREFETEEQLDLPAIARRMRISLTPLKEALRRLDHERLVDIRPRQGTYVSAVTVDRLQEVAVARILIEDWGVRAFKGTEERWDDINAILVESEELVRSGIDDAIELEDRFSTLDYEFHRAILAAGGNDPLTRFYDSLGSHVLLARAWCLQPAAVLLGQVQKGVSEHRAIIDVLKAGDRGAAAELMTQHIERSVAGACAIVEAHGGRI